MDVPTARSTSAAILALRKASGLTSRASHNGGDAWESPYSVTNLIMLMRSLSRPYGHFRRGLDDRDWVASPNYTDYDGPSGL